MKKEEKDIIVTKESYDAEEMKVALSTNCSSSCDD
jgi:hypothetical protein